MFSGELDATGVWDNHAGASEHGFGLEGPQSGGIVAEDALLTLMNYKSVPGNFDQASPVVSFGQLYTQALLVHGILRAKTEEWALKSQGYFPISVCDSEHTSLRTRMCSKWSDVADDLDVAGLVEWPCLKSSRRLQEKLVRSYDRGASRLLDLTRSWIFFDSVENLTACLRSMLTDPGVQLLRVKNTLAFGALLPPPSLATPTKAIAFNQVRCAARGHRRWPLPQLLARAQSCQVAASPHTPDPETPQIPLSFPSDADVSTTAGYRCVRLYLRVVSKETEMLGCELHICEVQLLLRSFGEAGSKESHERYVKYRDLGAE